MVLLSKHLLNVVTFPLKAHHIAGFTISRDFLNVVNMYISKLIWSNDDVGTCEAYGIRCGIDDGVCCIKYNGTLPDTLKCSRTLTYTNGTITYKSYKYDSQLKDVSIIRDCFGVGVDFLGNDAMIIGPGSKTTDCEWVVVDDCELSTMDDELVSIVLSHNKEVAVDKSVKPVRKRTTPTKKEITPTDDEKTPTKKKRTPRKKETTPTKKKTTPTKKKTTPRKKKTTHIEENNKIFAF